MPQNNRFNRSLGDVTPVFDRDTNPNLQNKLSAMSQAVTGNQAQQVGLQMGPRGDMSTANPQPPFIPGNSVGFDKAGGQLYDQARANVMANSPTAGQAPAQDDYNVKLAALQALAGKAPNPMQAQDIYKQIGDLKAKKQQLDDSDLEEVK